MKRFLQSLAICCGLAGPAGADVQTYRMATIAPSLGQAITMATFANIVSANLEDENIEVGAGGAATVHQLEVGRGNLEFAMTSPLIYNFMADGRVMYKGVADAPQAAGNLRLLMWFPYGQYHFTVRADSDIRTLEDLEGARVFLGPQGGGAFNGAKGWIEATTGLRVNEDYEAIKSNWQTGFQAFLDGKIDMYVNGCLDPCAQFLQITETEDIRFLGPVSHEHAAVDEWLGNFRYRAEVPANQYARQKNEGPVMSTGAVVGIAVRADLDDETVYRITRAFWDNLGQVTSDAPWAKALDVGFAARSLGQIELHPGAARYYQEAGVLTE
jgi:TRAP transporter TAXI family solute receptor